MSYYLNLFISRDESKWFCSLDAGELDLNECLQYFSLFTNLVKKAGTLGAVCLTDNFYSSEYQLLKNFVS